MREYQFFESIIFVQNVFCWRMRMSFWSRPSGRQVGEYANKTIMLQTLFFVQPRFKPLLIKFILTTKNDQTLGSINKR
jgi:hypothetical protein